MEETQSFCSCIYFYIGSFFWPFIISWIFCMQNHQPYSVIHIYISSFVLLFLVFWQCINLCFFPLNASLIWYVLGFQFIWWSGWWECFWINWWSCIWWFSIITKGQWWRWATQDGSSSTSKMAFQFHTKWVCCMA